MVTPVPEYSPEELHELLSGLMPDIPGYRVMRLLGRGGMSYVYLGVQESLDRQVAIKVIQPEALRDEISKLRFEREAQIIGKLQHPCIVGIYEIGRTEQGLLYYVLPYLARGHLGQRDLRQDQRGIIEVLRALLWALDYAHGRGVVHRDVKAENVLFDNADRPLLTDFGIALSRRDRSRVTGRGLAVGSGAHMAPEQARGESVDGRADLYSLGILTWEMLTGFLPYKNSDPLGLALMHAVDPVPMLPAALDHWQAFLQRALSKLPRDRFSDAREMMVALDEVEITLHRMGVPEPPGTRQRQSWHALGTWAKAARARVAETAALATVASEPVPTIDPPSDPPAPVSPPLAAQLKQRWQQLRQNLHDLPALPAPSRRWRAGGAALATVVMLGLAAALFWPDPTVPSLQTESTPRPNSPSPVDDDLPTAASVDAPTAAALPAVPKVDPVVDADSDADRSALDGGDALTGEALIDPLADLSADARLLAFAAEQIQRRRLSQPPGDNAYESLLAAEALSADPAQLSALGNAWLQAATPYITGAVDEGRDEAALLLLERGRELAGRLALQASPALDALREGLAGPLNFQFKEAIAARDVPRLRALKQRVTALSLPTAWFEPHWSQPLVLASPGDALPGTPGWRLLRLPQGDRAGLAMLATPVTREAYAAFVAESGRAATQCRVRTAMLTLKKRSWQDPGFAQQADHPVVCVSAADAGAYATWLGARQGQPLRLPSAEEWNRHAAHGAGCAAGAECEREGTRGAAHGGASALGIRASRGTVREWIAGGAGQRGESWRDAGERRSSRRDDTPDASRGYDDIGFRLVRSVPAAELETRIDPAR